MIDNDFIGHKGKVILRDEKFTKNTLMITNFEDIEITLLENNEPKNIAFYFIEKDSQEYPFFKDFYEKSLPKMKLPYFINDYDNLENTSKLSVKFKQKGILLIFENSIKEENKNPYRFTIRQTRSGSRNAQLTTMFHRLCEILECVRDNLPIPDYKKIDEEEQTFEEMLKEF